jgi:hypothetical protein
MVEIWKDIEGYEGLYQVSNKGRVKSLDRETVDKNGTVNRYKSKMLSPGQNKHGYKFCYLYKDLKRKLMPIHQLVAKGFVENKDNKPHVNHKDGIKQNNTPENLEWCTPSENIKHAYDMGLNYNSEKQKRLTSLANRGEKCHQSKLTEFDVRVIRDAWATGAFTQSYLSKEFGVGSDQISRIVNYKRWAWL